MDANALQLDIVIVTYNSARWLPGCIRALAGACFDLSRLHLVFVDNGSEDETLPLLETLQKENPGFGGFQILPQNGNAGFSVGCNTGAAAGRAPWVFFLNADTEVFPDALAELEQAAQDAEPQVGAFELRQLPYETGHHIDPATMETSWGSGAALVVRRAAFEQVGGFDSHLFMYCEDVDLSWRLRGAGYRILYLPKAALIHHSYDDGPGGAAMKLSEYAGGFYGNLLLRYKYGGFGDVCRGHAMYWGALRRPVHFDGVRRVLAKNYLRHFGKLWPFWFWRFHNREIFRQKPARFAGGFSPDRGLYKWEPLARRPLVSVVVRTYSRPETLRRTLLSLCRQTYENFEVIVAEDGKNTSETMVMKEFSHLLNLRYLCDGKQNGRAKNGNRGLAAAKGEYLCFLDDDDFFYPDHLELMAGCAVKNPDADLITAASMAMEGNLTVEPEYKLDVKDIYPIRPDRLDNFTLCQSCPLPIQSVLFKRWLFIEKGGLNEQLDGDEDWSMWIRYFSVAKRANPTGLDIPRATSVFQVPADTARAKERELYYQQFEDAMLDEPGVAFTVTPRQMREYYEGMVGDIRHLKNIGELDGFLEKDGRRTRWDED